MGILPMGRASNGRDARATPMSLAAQVTDLCYSGGPQRTSCNFSAPS